MKTLERVVVFTVVAVEVQQWNSKTESMAVVFVAQGVVHCCLTLFKGIFDRLVQVHGGFRWFLVALDIFGTGTVLSNEIG